MQLTKYTHSCVRLDDGERSLVIDPGTFSESEQALAGVDAVLVTHEHADHLDPDALVAAAGQRPGLRVWCPSSVAAQLEPLADRITVVEPGEEFDAAGFAVRAFGGQHALIHTDVPVVGNLGYLVDDAVFHPGDAFSVPDAPVEVLLLPISAPWSKVGEVLDFLTAVRAPQAFQIHDGMLNSRGLGVVEGHVNRVARQRGSRYEHLDTGETVQL